MADIEMAGTAWASLWIREGRGALLLGETENGDVGVWVNADEDAKALGVGDTVAEALEDAHTRWHGSRPAIAECRCVELAEEGESLTAYVGVPPAGPPE